MKNSNYLKILSKKSNVPINVKSCVGIHERSKVHTNGWWHCGVLTNLIRFNPSGNLQILVQKRSKQVDIAKGRYDQSLASQMRNTDSTIEETFLRGIREELNINKEDVEYEQFLPESSFYIIKEYNYDDNVVNKERIYLFVAKLRNNISVTPDCTRVDSTKWVDWEHFAKDIIKHPQKYTKTVRFFITNKELKQSLEVFMVNFLKGDTVDKLNDKNYKVLYYSPRSNEDVVTNLS